jgi:SIR2-like domain/TIR domain
MSVSGDLRDGATDSSSGSGAVPLKIFINYRHADAGGWASFLHKELSERFGAENVFLDGATLQPGRKWLDDIRSHGSECGVFIALVGPSWASIMSKRTGGAEEDYVRSEIELALRRTGGVEVIPVLVGEAQMPQERHLPATLRPLLRRQSVPLRPPPTWDADLQLLIATLEAAARSQPSEPSEPSEPSRPPEPEDGPDPLDEADVTPVHDEADGAERVETRDDDEHVAPRPDRRHYRDVVELILDEASSVVPFLGPGANSSDRDDDEPAFDEECSYLPDADELAAYLAHELGLKPARVDLARASQYMWEAKGKGRLKGMLKRALTARCPPGSVHTFLANLPKKLRELDLERYQLIVTTNYDDALERAFDDADEEYDLLVYMKTKGPGGKFVHVPYGAEPEVIDDPAKYTGIPINLDTYALTERTVIMKIHGAVDRERRLWTDQYVVTEDDYIDYLSHGPDSIVPAQIKDKLEQGYFLFLGYTMRDWNLRVFLQRMFGQQLPNNSWAIQRDPDALDVKFWGNMRVDAFDLLLTEYVTKLGAELEASARTVT